MNVIITGEEAPPSGGASVEMVVVAGGASGVDNADLVKEFRSAFEDPDVVLVYLSESEQPTEWIPGSELLRRILRDVLDPFLAGPVAIRRSLVERMPKPRFTDGPGLVRCALDGLIDGTGVILDRSQIGTEVTGVAPKRWLDPEEVETWLEVVDAAAVLELLSEGEELATTAELLRRAVLLPDFTDLGPKFDHGLLVVDLVAERADALLTGRPVVRTAQGRLAVVPVAFDPEGIPSANWWEQAETTSEGVTREGRSVLLAGADTTSEDLDRFAVFVGDHR